MFLIHTMPVSCVLMLLLLLLLLGNYTIIFTHVAAERGSPNIDFLLMFRNRFVTAENIHTASVEMGTAFGSRPVRPYPLSYVPR
jgi:hypothetical protein